MHSKFKLIQAVCCDVFLRYNMTISREEEIFLIKSINRLVTDSRIAGGFLLWNSLWLSKTQLIPDFLVIGLYYLVQIRKIRTAVAINDVFPSSQKKNLMRIAFIHTCSEALHPKWPYLASYPLPTLNYVSNLQLKKGRSTNQAEELIHVSPMKLCRTAFVRLYCLARAVHV